MDQNTFSVPLSQIETDWSQLFRAHGEVGEEAVRARQQLVEHYNGAVRSYLVAITGDPELAADLAQEFAVRLLTGSFRRADPRRGRFRDFLKRSLLHLVIDSRRRQRVRPRPLSAHAREPATPSRDLAELDRQFLDCWREELLRHAWEGLVRDQETTGQPIHTVLRHRVDHPALSSPELAERLSGALGRPVTPGWVRQNLHRARGKFSRLIRDEVARSLVAPTAEEVEEELMDLGLWEYCRATLGAPLRRGTA